MQEVFKDVSFRSHYPPYGALVLDLDDTDMAHIERLGLTSLCRIPALLVNHGLLIAFVEHFHSKTNTFHLPQEEMTVTPEDIYRILRIPFHGPRVSYDIVPREGIVALCTIFGR